jgi:hypothetical protein
MNDEEFKKRLSEVADWHIPDLKDWEIKQAKQKARGKGRPSAEEKYQEEHEAIFLEMFNGKNPTIQPVVTNVKVQSCMCEDCGRFCEKGRRTELTRYTTNRTHWRERCVTCGMNKNPNTGAWDLSNKDASGQWSNWLRKTSSKAYCYKKRKIITIYPETNKEI